LIFVERIINYNMKTLTTLILAIVLASCCPSCTSIKSTSDAALAQAKTGASVGFTTEKVEKGYQVSGHASTNVFGIEPYGSFTAGIKYAPKRPAAPADVEPAK
jgi:uncharacterized lipoprotein YajG